MSPAKNKHTDFDLSDLDEDPWLERLEAAREAEAIEQHCASPAHERVLKFFDLCLKMCAVKLEPDAGNPTQQLAFSGRFKFTPNLEPPLVLLQHKRLAQLWAFFNSKPAAAFFYTAVLGFSIKLFLLSYLCFEHDRMLMELIKQLEPQGNGCVLAEDLDKLGAIRSSLEEYNSALGEMGALLSSVMGSGVLLNAVIAALPVMFFVFTVIFNYRELRSNFLDFILDPRNELRQFEEKLRSIRRKMATFAGPESHRLGHSCCCPAGVCLSASKRTPMQASNDSRTDIDLAESLDSLIRGREIKLYTLSSGWQQTLSKMGFRANAIGIVSSMIISLLTFSSLVMYEIYWKTIRRLDQLQCRSQNPNSTSLGSFIEPLSPLRSQDHLEAYNSFDGSQRQFLRLWLFIEPEYYFSSARIYTLAESAFIICLYSWWAPFYGTLYLMGFIHENAHLLQLEAQLKHCIGATMAFNEARPASAGTPRQSAERRVESLRRKLNICYFCFELFRQNHTTSGKFTNFLIQQVIAFTLVTLATCYVIAANLDAKFIMPIIEASLGAVCLLDVYLATISYKLKRIERVMRHVASLLAHLRAGKLATSRQVALWNRQLLSDQETQWFFTFNFCGEYLSYEKLIALNAHLVALWLLAVYRTSKIAE